MNISDMKPGDVLSYWHDAGICAQLKFATVIRTGKVKVRVRSESGYETWQYPWFFTENMGQRSIAELIQ